MTPDNGGEARRLFLRSMRMANYKCFADFELSFGAMTLLLGKNGCGKTAVFDAMYALRQFVCRGEDIAEAFPHTSLVRWNNDNEQLLELRAAYEGEGGEFCYRLVVDHQLRTKKSRMKRELLTLDGKKLFEFDNGDVQLYRDDHSPGPRFSHDWGVSGITGIPERKDNRNLSQFRRWLDSVTLLSPAPDKMLRVSDKEARYLDENGANFASWYRWILLEDRAKVAAADEALRGVLPGYQRMALTNVGKNNHWELRVVFASGEGAEQDYAFDELSSGQRVLIVLYFSLHGDGRNRLLLLDEPDNFVTLPEVQPLILKLDIGAGDELPQIAMISHHPEAVSFISDKETVWMAREPEQPARVVEFKNDTKIHTAKLYARGLAP